MMSSHHATESTIDSRNLGKIALIVGICLILIAYVFWIIQYSSLFTRAASTAESPFNIVACLYFFNADCSVTLLPIPEDMYVAGRIFQYIINTLLSNIPVVFWLGAAFLLGGGGVIASTSAANESANTKDLISAALLITFAVVGTWLNMEHNMGSARRMGPGYMPFLGFVILLGLGAIVLAIGMFNGPDPLAKWTPQEIIFLVGGAVVGVGAGMIAARVGGWPSAGWNSLGIGMFVGCLVPAIIKSWRPLFLVSAAFALFGLVLEPLGLMLAITLAVVLSAFADETHKPLGVAGLVVFLCALCYAVFIYELDIRVPVWPQF